MSNHFVQKIASVILILGIFVSIFMAAQTARADFVIPSGIPFGGRILGYVPPSLVCPGHTIVLDQVSFNIIAVAVIPILSQVYMNYDLYTEGKSVLGTYLLPPIICPLPYPILPISQVGTS